MLSNTLTASEWPNTRFVRSLGEIADLKKQAGKDIYLVGGARTAASLLDAGLVDELHLLVHPIVVGHGKKLFTDGPTVPLTLVSSTTFDTGVVHLVYAGVDSAEAGN